MSDSLDQRIRHIMSGQARGPFAMLSRIVLACVEPIYTAIVGTRNHLFDRELVNIARLPRPVISVGNITTGGTGKTPVVQWIVRELQSLSHRPAVLLRGYKRQDAQSTSDEEQLLRESLGVPVFADPKRALAGQRAIKAHPEIDVIVLDDGFQHRKLYRDLDIVLIDATNPFGYGHVLPRGMLRESLASLARVNVVILTRVELAPDAQVAEIEQTVRRRNPAVPILKSNHRLDQITGDGPPRSIETLHGRRVWAFCGIGNPDAFESSLRKAGIDIAGMTRFADHHAYDAGDLEQLQASAARVGATVLLTTEKDSVKLQELSGLIGSLPVWSIGVRIEMNEADSAVLRSMIRGVARGEAVSAVNPARRSSV